MMLSRGDNMRPIVGLTGGIASGKSTVSLILSRLGAIIIDADKISRAIVSKGSPALDEIKSIFGDEMLLENGELNRRKLAELVFNDEAALKRLNQITHPRIISEIEKEIYLNSLNFPDSVIIIDAALLIEMNMIQLVDEVWLVSVPLELQKHRLKRRDNLSSAEVERRIAAQMSREDKLRYADYVIDNTGKLEDLEEQVKLLWQKLTMK
jgi:dephospho-CoA kinase